jgi:hypothetical protein
VTLRRVLKRGTLKRVRRRVLRMGAGDRPIVTVGWSWSNRSSPGGRVRLTLAPATAAARFDDWRYATHVGGGVGVGGGLDWIGLDFSIRTRLRCPPHAAAAALSWVLASLVYVRWHEATHVEKSLNNKISQYYTFIIFTKSLLRVCRRSASWPTPAPRRWLTTPPPPGCLLAPCFRFDAGSGRSAPARRVATPHDYV